MMNFSTLRLLRNVLIVFALAGSALHAVNTDSIELILQSSHIPTADLGILIEDSHGVIFELNAGRKMVPASLTKIVTGAAAFELLNPQYQFRTQLLTEGVQKGSVLDGSIYIKGGGDPSFTAAKLPLMIHFLSTQGIRRITGDVVIDNFRFADPIFDTSAKVQRLIQLWDPKGYPLFLNFEPVKQYSRTLERRIRSIILPKKDRDFVVYCNMSQPDLWTGHKFFSYLRQAGIDVQGTVERGDTPLDAKLITEVRSPLTAIVSQMMKASSNFYAEMLTRNLAAVKSQTSVTTQEGMSRIQEFLDHVGIPRSDYLIRSGAGFSTQNSFSAQTLARVLDHMKEEKTIFSFFKDSFAIAGVDGTLKTRMRNTPAERRIFAKTGHLNKIVGLAGYALQSDGSLITFVFMYNGSGSSHAVQSTFDRLCVELVRPTMMASADKE